jgi:hypothetical protein
MIRAGFLLADDRLDMIALARAGAAGLVLLDDGWSCEKVAKALYVDDDPKLAHRARLARALRRRRLGAV